MTEIYLHIVARIAEAQNTLAAQTTAADNNKQEKEKEGHPKKGQHTGREAAKEHR